MNIAIENFLNHLQSAQFAALLLDALLKSFVVLALAGGICVLWRRASSATRHLIWLLAVASLPFLPLLNSTHPVWQKQAWSISTDTVSGNQVSLALELAPKPGSRPALNGPVTPKISPAESNGPSRKIARFNAHWMFPVSLVWLGGMAIVLLKSIGSRFYRRKFLRSAQPLTHLEWTRLLTNAREILHLRRPVTLLQSSDSVMPMTWGWWRPVVLLPAEAEQWGEERRRIVLLHELAHVKRGDYLTQSVAQLVCALYWFNPLVWLAARQMYVERESACDDLVLRGGCKASEYAGHLVEIAAHFRPVPQMAAIAMARPSRLEGRIAAIVDGSRNRRPRLAAALAVLALIGGIALSVGGIGSNAVGPDKSDALLRGQIEWLKAFSKQKEKQSQTLAAASGETISSEFQRFFDAATSGEWQTVTNMYGSFKQRHPQYSHAGGYSDVSLRTSYWSPVLEICLAYDHVMRCEPEYTQMAVEGIINSIPAGSIYFGGTDPGRGLPTAFCNSHADADPFYTLTQNALADGTYLDYLRSMYGNQRALLDTLARECHSDPALQKLNSEWKAAVQKLKSLDNNENDPKWKAANEVVNTLWEQRHERVKAITDEVRSDGMGRVDRSTGGDSQQTADDIAKLKSEVAETREQIAQLQTRNAGRPAQKEAEQSDLERKLKQQMDNLNYYEQMVRSGPESNVLNNGLYIPTTADSQQCFHQYAEDVAKRLENHELEPGEEATNSNGQIQISGRVSVMQINGLLTKLVFDQNPGHEVFIEESWPLDWMYPYLEPHGLIMKINREPRPKISDAAVQEDTKYWQPRVTQMIGGWLKEGTPVSDVTAFGEKVFLRHNLAGFSGDPRFVGNDYATRMFSKFRSDIAGLYAWRAEHAKDAGEKERMARAADFAFRQAVAMCPYSPEGAYARYAGFLKSQHREADARLIEGLAERLKAADASASANGPVFQLRLALDVPMDNTGPMRLESGTGAEAKPLYVGKEVLLNDGAIQSAKLDKSPQGYWEIEISLSGAGGEQIAEITRQHLHQRLAMVIDGRLWMAPVVQSPITEGKAMVTGSFSEDEAKDLVAKLNAAAGWKPIPESTHAGVQTGAQAVVVTAITPLYLTISLDSVVTNEAGANYVIKAEKQAAATPAGRAPRRHYISQGDKKPNDTFAMEAIKGPAENPDALRLKLVDTGEKVVITKDQSYRRVDGYAADFRYDPEKKVFRGRRANDKVHFGGGEYTVAEVTQDGLILVDQSNQEKTHLPIAH